MNRRMRRRIELHLLLSSLKRGGIEPLAVVQTCIKNPKRARLTARLIKDIKTDSKIIRSVPEVSFTYCFQKCYKDPWIHVRKIHGSTLQFSRLQTALYKNGPRRRRWSIEIPLGKWHTYDDTEHNSDDEDQIVWSQQATLAGLVPELTSTLYLVFSIGSSLGIIFGIFERRVT